MMATSKPQERLRVADAPPGRSHGQPALVHRGPLVPFTRWWRLAPPQDDPARSVVYGSDFALLKRRADVTLRGSAHAPGGRAERMLVRFRFGHRDNRFDRQLAVLGERIWRSAGVGLSPSEPQPFARLPLVYDRAFGGPGHRGNPCGVGASGRGPHIGDPLPNVEDPERLIVSPGDRPEPAGFAPLGGLWPLRWAKIGSYGPRYLPERWPFFPGDFDLDYFQHAPAGQQLDLLRGDEPFELGGLHPEHGVLRGSLPGLRVRCFAQTTEPAGGLFFEVPLGLDTVHFDLEEGKLTLLWRGLLEVSGEEALELGALFFLHEPLAEAPLGLEAAHQRYRAALGAEQPVADHPEGEPEPANRAGPAGPEEDLDAQAEARRQEILADVAALGLPMSLEQIQALADKPDEPPPPFDPKAFEPVLDRAGLDAETRAEIAKPLEQVAQGEPPAEAEEAPEDLRVRVVAMLAAGESFDGLDLTGADLHDLDLSGRSLVGTTLHAANLRGCSFATADLSRAALGQADLTDANLQGAKLAGADLSRAKLGGAQLAGADLQGAQLGQVSAPDADFAGAEADEIYLGEAQLEGCSFRDASLAKADFTRARLDRACFDGARGARMILLWAKGEKVSFQGADLSGACAHEAAFPGARLDGALASGSNWYAADLSRSAWRRGSLAGATLLHTSFESGSLEQTDLSGARLDRLRGRGAVLRKANLMQASAQGADLAEADLRGANLYGAALWEATLAGAKLDEAIIDGTLLAR
ncbi:MAG: DUF2169 domain-containing protein [Deltaproteobacteria bacterium]|nr:DUF2169 domain-containing protein [Deltaproteobacteria bacterium]